MSPPHSPNAKGSVAGKKGSPGSPKAVSQDNIERLAELAGKLTEIRKQKEALKIGNKYTKSKNDAPIIGDYSHRPKKLFNHPKLDHVYGQIVFSPYNFSPTVSLT
jgi:hypothetical protein